MIDKQIQRLTATKLRLILILLMVLLVVGSAAGFWYFRQQLSAYASQVSIDNAAAASSSNDISQLQRLKAEMDNNQVAITRAQKIVADSSSYQYQAQIIDDLSSYAKAAHIQVTGFTFADGTTPSADQSTPGVPTTPAGLKSITAVIDIKSPVDYHNIMNFLYSIELNLTKMNITSISLTKGASANQVIVNPISIEVYTQ